MDCQDQQAPLGIHRLTAMRWAAVVAALLPAATSYKSSPLAQCEGDDISGMTESEAEQMQVDLLQTRMRLSERSEDPGLRRPEGSSTASFLRTQAAATELSAEERTSLIVPIAWFHVMKTGTSFCNTLYHTPGICPGFPADKFLASSSEEGEWDDDWGDRSDLCSFSASYNRFASSPLWYGLADVFPHSKQGPHAGVGGLAKPLFQLNSGHFVTMLRQPEQRLISQYYYYGPSLLYGYDMTNRSVWPFQTRPEDGFGSAFGRPAPYKTGLREFAEWNGGCVVRQLTMGVREPCFTFPLPTSDDVAVAIDMLHDGFAFVGITEEWALSVCLFRKMFGGSCLASDLANTRPTDNASSTAYDTSELYGWVDIWDGPLYAEAKSLFDSTRKVYGADVAECSSFCGLDS